MTYQVLLRQTGTDAHIAQWAGMYCYWLHRREIFIFIHLGIRVESGGLESLLMAATTR